MSAWPFRLDPLSHCQTSAEFSQGQKSQTEPSRAERSCTTELHVAAPALVMPLAAASCCQFCAAA
jgi:hypothetical protein